jgi:hypothetical protein
VNAVQLPKLDTDVIYCPDLKVKVDVLLKSIQIIGLRLDGLIGVALGVGVFVCVNETVGVFVGVCVGDDVLVGVGIGKQLFHKFVLLSQFAIVSFHIQDAGVCVGVAVKVVVGVCVCVGVCVGVGVFV